MIREEIIRVIRKASGKELRKFGITIGVFLFIVAGVLFWKQLESARYVAYIAGAFLLLGLAVPIVLKPIYIIWMSSAVVMGFIMSHVILGIVFGLVFTPAGLVMRLLGKDPLKEKIDPNAKSYWIPRERKPFDPKSLERQY